MTTDRLTVLLDAAIAVVGSGGLRGLTHRAVDARAGVAAGSTSYYFRTRSALLRGILGRLLELDTAEYERFATDGLDSGIDRRTLTSTLTKLYGHWSSQGRDRQLARYALYLDPGVDDEVRAQLDAANRQLAGELSQLLRAAGCPHPKRDARLLIALLDGLLYDRLARPEPPISAAELRRRIDVVLGTVLP